MTATSSRNDKVTVGDTRMASNEAMVLNPATGNHRSTRVDRRRDYPSSSHNRNRASYCRRTAAAGSYGVLIFLKKSLWGDSISSSSHGTRTCRYSRRSVMSLFCIYSKVAPFRMNHHPPPLDRTMVI
jgi:hypothetical protein